MEAELAGIVQMRCDIEHQLDSDTRNFQEQERHRKIAEAQEAQRVDADETAKAAAAQAAAEVAETEQKKGGRSNNRSNA